MNRSLLFYTENFMRVILRNLSANKYKIAERIMLKALTCERVVLNSPIFVIKI